MVLFFMGGCSLQTTVPAISKYSLNDDYDVKAVENSHFGDKVIRMGVIENSALLSGTNIYYSSDNGQSYSYTKARWSEGVNSQLGNLMMHTITKTKIFKDVLPLRSLARSDLILEMNIYDFSQQIHTDGTTTLHLSVKLRVVEEYSRKIIATKLFEMEQNENEGNIEGALKGYNKLVVKLLSETNSWLKESSLQ
jgi:ABC-type uncharacterized transport system auxiliary subunit